MMKRLNTAIALAALLVSHTVFAATELDESIEIQAAPEQVWSQISDFCSIRYWAAKAILDCTQYMEHGSHYRKLTLNDGSDIYEKLVDITDQSFSYTITKADTPIKKHLAKMSLSYIPATGITVLKWHVSLTVDGNKKTQDRIEAAFRSIMKDGLASIREVAQASH